MRFALALSVFLLFEPIIIDEATLKEILQGAHQNMRGPEYDMLSNVLNQLEQRAVDQKRKTALEPAK